MFPRALRLLRLAGIDVRLDPSLLVIAALVAWTFVMRFAGEHGWGLGVGMAVLATLVFFASLLAHELAHALEARHRGIEVHGITLFLLGGVTEMRAGGRTPRDEFAISAVGPYASLVCGAALGLGATLAPLLGAPAGQPLAEVLGVLAWLNIALAVFNLVPGAPLDGGRVLRATLWWLLRDRYRAVRIAGRAGQALAAALIAFGAYVALPVDLGGAGGGLSAVWWIVIGAFILQAARAELRQGDIDRVLDHRVVADVLPREPEPALTAEQPADVVDVGRTSDWLPVVDGDDVVGVLSPRAVVDLHPADRSVRMVGELMHPVHETLPEVAPETDLRALVDLLLSDAEAVVVRDRDRVLAVLREPDVARALEVLRRRGGRTPAPVPAEPAP